MSQDTLATIMQEYKREKRELIPLLQRTQAAYGYLRPDAIKKISRWLKLSENEVYGVVTFYAQFRFHPPGEHHIKVCLGTACHVSGALNFLEVLKADLNLSHGETTLDSKFSLERVACLGCCSLAPVVVTNNEVHGRMNRVKFIELLEKLKGVNHEAEPYLEKKEQEGAMVTGDAKSQVGSSE